MSFYQFGCAVAKIPLQLNEEGMFKFKFLCDEIENSTYPQINVISSNIFDNCEIELVIAKRFVCKCADIATTISLSFSSYYAFSIAYLDKQTSALKFFQKAFHKIEDDCKKHNKVSRLPTAFLCH